jgi:lipoprotein-anchoring transpeptidase ErfK/SrfK
VLLVSSCTAVAAADRLPADPPPPIDGASPAADPGPTPPGLLADRDDPTANPLSPLPPDPDLVPPFPASDAGPEDGHDRGTTIVAHATTPTIAAHATPEADGAVLQEFANPTERGGPLVFQAVGQPRDGWLEVLLPVRPNGTTGWIRVDDVELTRNPYRIEIDLDRYHIDVWRGDELRISAPVAVGKGGTPTPIGDFYLVELLQPPEPDGPYGAYAYGLSGYSDVLDNFNGGDGVIGIHGTNQPSLLGGPASHGCIRLHDDVITEMAGFLPLGTPVTIGPDPGGDASTRYF